MINRSQNMTKEPLGRTEARFLARVGMEPTKYSRRWGLLINLGTEQGLTGRTGKDIGHQKPQAEKG